MATFSMTGKGEENEQILEFILEDYFMQLHHDLATFFSHYIDNLEVTMKELTREDWERIKGEIENERKTMLISMEINNAALHMVETKLKFLPKEKKEDEKVKKPKPSSYVG